LKTCKLCQQSKVDRTRRTAHGTFQQINLPFSRIGADIVGPLHVTKEGYRYILFLICHASRWTEAIPLRVADTTNVLKAFHDNWITRYGIPDEVISDNSSVFDGKAATSFWNDRKIQKIKVSAYHQSSNGLCERNISELVDTLKLNSGELTDTWADQLPTALASLRNKMSNATGLSPYQYIFGADMSSPISETLGIQKRLDIAARLLTHIRTEENRSQEGTSIFKVNDLVLVKNSSPEHKFSPRWSGPYTITKQVSNHVFDLEDSRKNQIRRHTDLMKQYWRRGDEEETENGEQKKKKKKKEKEYEIEKIVYSKIVDGERMYRIRWKGFTEQDDTWEPLSHFSKLSLVRNFHKTHKLPFS
jgi:hypothetical protein